MKLTEIQIENFKSIKDITFDIKKYGSSYTTMFLGVNESGKSNILKAMSFFDTPEEELDYYAYHNQKDEKNSPVDLWFSLVFEDKTTCVNELRKSVENGNLLNFEITDIVKNIYLQHDEETFSEQYDFNIKKLTESLFVKKTKKSVTNPSGQQTVTTVFEISKTAEDETFQVLNNDVFKDIFSGEIEAIIKKHEPSVTFWKPSEEYLISSEDLNKFSENINSKPALKNIFLLAGYDTKDSIQSVVKTIPNGQQRSKLKSNLEDKLDRYVKKVWKHDIDIVIDITETGQFTLSIKDSGEENKHDRLAIDGRSEGARHFLSLILSLSIESEHKRRTNQLILIDEPEAHLHPSGIRDLRNELLKIGESNYLFVATHSPFLVDRKSKERNIVIKKNHSAITKKIHIQKHTNIIDDEVLREAFGLEVYKDLLNPHSILVEGASDKQILQKAFVLKSEIGFGVTNGHGSNVDTLASKLNDVNISILVLLDDDKDGKNYKEKIIKIGGSYSASNVVTIRDLVGTVIDGGTIEDMLGKNFVESKVKELYKSSYKEECDIKLQETSPFIKQIKVHLQKNAKNDSDKFIEELKDKLSTDFNPTKALFSVHFPLLDSLVGEIVSKLKKA